MSTRKGELRVNVISARGLRDTAIFGIQDPYVQVKHLTSTRVTPKAAAMSPQAPKCLHATSCQSNCFLQLLYGSFKVKTAVHKDGGTSPVWNESIKL